MRKVYSLLSIILLSLWGCSSNEDFKKNPVDVIIRDMSKEVESFSIILHDMEVEGTFTRDYKHQYKVIKEIKGQPVEEITSWHTVSKTFFQQHENDMGMEIAARDKDGKLSKNAAPPGYSNYVGNPQYGQWVDNGNGNMMWSFFAQYAMMSMMFNMMAMPAYRSGYNDFRSNYYGRNSYYGPTTSNGTPTYGSQSSFARKTAANSRWKKSGTSSRFGSTNNSATRKTGSSFWNSSRTSRSGSRWGGSSSSGSFRSRSRGFGK